MTHIISTKRNIGYIVGDICTIDELRFGDVCSQHGELIGNDTALVVGVTEVHVSLCRFRLALIRAHEIPPLQRPIAVLEIPGAEALLDLGAFMGVHVWAAHYHIPRTATLPNNGGPLRFYVHQRLPLV
jgi:hypothetical protein